LKSVSFSGKEEGARTKVYGLLAHQVAKKIRWNLSSDVSFEETTFIIEKPTSDGQIKQSKSDLYTTTDKLYKDFKEDKHTGAFMIALEWENQVKSLTRKYKNLPGYNSTSVEDLIAEVQSQGAQSIVGLVNSFKPNTKTADGKNIVSLSGYINKWLPQYIQAKIT